MAPDGVTQRYSFTVTLKPKCFLKPAEDQYDMSVKVLCQLLQTKVNCYTLVAELTKNANVHYHGIVNFKMGIRNINKYFQDMFRAHPVLGFVNIKVMDNEPGWVDYIKKDIKVTYESVGRRPIVHDGFDSFPEGMFEAYGISE